MSYEEQQLESLRTISPKATLDMDGGVCCVCMPEVHLHTPSGIQIMEVVLCPKGLGGYITRLLMDQKINKPNLNWQVVPLLGRTWHTCSWNNISPDQPWIRIYAEHARVLR